MRLYCAAFCLIACDCFHPTYDQVDAAMQAAVACIRYEAAAVAPADVDLDGATAAVLANCAGELNYERAMVFVRYGQDRDPLQPPVEELVTLRKGNARDAVANVRAHVRLHHKRRQARNF
jgi:hypothetical protein